jgi:hypothetical protein
MATESLVALGFMAVFFVLLSWYVSNHRIEDKNKHQRRA